MNAEPLSIDWSAVLDTVIGRVTTAGARVWVKNADYWTVHFDLLEMVKKSFDKNGIEIPFNQLDVHVVQ